MHQESYPFCMVVLIVLLKMLIIAMQFMLLYESLGSERLVKLDS